MNICTTETAAASQDTVNGKNPHSLIDWVVSAIASSIGRAAALSDSGAVPTYAATVLAPPSVAVVVEGKLEGNIQASDRVDLKQSAVVTGDVVTQRISIDDGGYFKGRVNIQREAFKKEVVRRPPPK